MASMEDRMVRYGFFLLVVCAVALTVRSFVGRTPAEPLPRPGVGVVGTPEGSLDSVRLENWPEIVGNGHRMGPSGAPVTIVEFGDFECPACRAFHQRVLEPVRALYPTQVALVFRHWPLPYHRFATPAARAAECAASQGRFHAMHDLLYQFQDSLGLKPFESYARDAGVGDLEAFEDCVHDTSPMPAVDRDTLAVMRLGGQGTPTVVVNGLLLRRVPDSTLLVQLIEQALTGPL